MDKLSDVKLRNVVEPGKHFDGGGLYLEVTLAGGRHWRLTYRFARKEKRLAFGVYPEVSLKLARERRAEARRRIAQKIRANDIRGMFVQMIDEVMCFVAKRIGRDPRAVLTTRRK
jgi:hypothetical protein